MQFGKGCHETVGNVSEARKALPHNQAELVHSRLLDRHDGKMAPEQRSCRACPSGWRGTKEDEVVESGGATKEKKGGNADDAHGLASTRACSVIQRTATRALRSKELEPALRVVRLATSRNKELVALYQRQDCRDDFHWCKVNVFNQQPAVGVDMCVTGEERR